MRVFVDTNVLLSAALFPSGTAARAYWAVLTGGHGLVVSDYVIAELLDVVARKFPGRTAFVRDFCAALPAFATVMTGSHPGIAGLRDPKDEPILAAARTADCDVILTGDKDLLEAGLQHPEAVSPAEFVNRA